MALVCQNFCRLYPTLKDGAFAAWESSWLLLMPLKVHDHALRHHSQVKKKNACEVKAIEECGQKPATTYKYQNSPPAPPNLHPNALQLGATSARTVGQASIQMPI